MPVMDGITVLVHARKEHILTQILLHTAKSEIDDKITGLDADANDYLTKPFDMRELLRGSAYTKKRRSAKQYYCIRKFNA